MSYIKFQDSDKKIYDGAIIPIDAHTIKTKNLKQDFSGIGLYSDGDNLIGDYSEFIYEYDYPNLQTYEFMYTNDNHPYMPPTPPEPTLEEVKQAKIKDLNKIQQEAFVSGFDVVLSDGESHHFTLEDRSQLDLLGLSGQLMQGAEQIPWHEKGEKYSKNCMFYSAEDGALITQTGMEYVTFHVTYYINLCNWVDSMETKEEVQSVYYGIYIPKEQQGEVMSALYEKRGTTE